MTFDPQAASELTAACDHLANAEALTGYARELRDELITLGAAAGATYRELADATGLSLGAVWKIAAARGVRKYHRPPDG